jgi:DNA-binding response OmpR family regulator
MSRILVVDDDAKIVTLVSAYLQRAGYEVRSAHDGLTALRMIREEAPDAVVLDLMLPELDGLGVARIAREETMVPILMLTARGTVPDRVRGLEAGADDYLAKPFAPAELVARVRSLLRRVAPPAAERVLRQADLELDLDRRLARRGDEQLDLTSLEFDLLAALLGASGRVLTRGALMNVLELNSAEPILERSIDAYVARLRAKLGDPARAPHYIETVRGVGYRTNTGGALSGR